MQLLFEAREQAHAVHPAVRQAVQALAGRLPGGAAVLASSRQRFVLYAARELRECSRLYATSPIRAMVRARAQMPMFVAMAEHAAAMDNKESVVGELLSSFDAARDMAYGLVLAHMSCWLAMAQALHAQTPEQHREFATYLLMEALRIARRYAESEALYRQALEVERRKLGEEHHETLNTINNLAMCVSDRGRYAEAEALYRQALEVKRRVLGEEHPDTIRTINNLAISVAAQGRFAESEPLHRQALEAKRRVLGGEHPETLSSISNLALCIKLQGRDADAEPLHRQALEAKRRVLGGEHPDTLTSIATLAICVAAQGRYAESEPLYRQALEGRRRVLGEEHPRTLAIAEALKSCQDKLKAA